MEEKEIEFVESNEDFFCPFCGAKLEKILYKKIEGGLMGNYNYVYACSVCKKVIPVVKSDLG